MNTETHRLLDSNEPLFHASTALSDLIEACPYPTHLADAQTGQYICCNSEFSDYIGIPIKDIYGLTVQTCFNQRQWKEETTYSTGGEKQSQKICKVQLKNAP